MASSAIPSSQPAALSGFERALLLAPVAAGSSFGLGLLLTPGTRFTGAGDFGYALALALGLLAQEWAAARLPVVAALAINLLAALACCLEIVTGSATPMVYLALGVSAVAGASAGLLLARRRGMPRSAPDAARWMVALLLIQASLAAALGLPALLVPDRFAQALGIAGADLFLYRLGGAALLGYGAMALCGARCRNRAELRVPAVMVLALCVLCALVAIISLAIGERSALGYLVAALAPLMALAALAQLRDQPARILTRAYSRAVSRAVNR